MYVDLGTAVRRSKDVLGITCVLKSALVPDLVKERVVVMLFCYFETTLYKK